MSLPPPSFRGETPGMPCGHTYADSLVVDGRLPNGFGADETQKLDPVVSDLSGGPGEIGWDTDVERDRRGQLLGKIEEASEDLANLGADLTPDERASLRWLLQRARAQVGGAMSIHDRWRSRPGGSWPLSEYDRVTNHPLVADPSDCAGNFGGFVKGKGRHGQILCPTQWEVNQRPKDRKAILQLYIDAAHHIRCAEYGLWRMVLYKHAKELFDQTPAGQALGGLATPPEGEFDPELGTLVPTGPSLGTLYIPPQPPDVHVPDPATLPPASKLPDVIVSEPRKVRVEDHPGTVALGYAAGFVVAIVVIKALARR